MTQDEIMAMWKESGGFYTIGIPYDILKAFAKLVEERGAAKEREACAKVCDSWGIGEAEGAAHEIRARGEA